MSNARRVISAIGVVVSAAIGIVTNLITDRWSWTLAGTLAALVILAVVLALLPNDPTGGHVTQKAARGGRILRSPIRAHGGRAQQKATRTGTIEDSGIDVQ